MRVDKISKRDTVTQRLDAVIAGRWVELGEVVIVVEDDVAVELIDYIPSKPLNKQKIPKEVLEHLRSQGENDGRS
jgi:hypothetical protein